MVGFRLILQLLALVCFVLDTVQTGSRINLQSLGLALLVGSFMAIA